jgi:hypothetical protein
VRPSRGVIGDHPGQPGISQFWLRQSGCATNGFVSVHVARASAHDGYATDFEKNGPSCVFSLGAGDGNRTRTISLGS